MPSEAVHDLAKEFQLTLEERTRLRPNSSHFCWDNDVHWARMTLANEGIIDKSRRGIWVLVRQK